MLRACSPPTMQSRSTRRISTSTTSSAGSRSSCAASARRRNAMDGADLAWALGRIYMGIPARFVSRARLYGSERMPREGGAVLAVNHLHWIDIPIVGATSPRTIHFVAKVEAAGFPLLGRFLRWHGTIAIRRGESDRDAVRAMRQAGADRQCGGPFVAGARPETGRPGK